MLSALYDHSKKKTMDSPEELEEGMGLSHPPHFTFGEEESGNSNNTFYTKIKIFYHVMTSNFKLIFG